MIYILQDHRKHYIVLDTVNKISSLWCKRLTSAIQNFNAKIGTTDSWVDLSKDYLNNNYYIIFECNSISGNIHDFKNMCPELFI